MSDTTWADRVAAATRHSTPRQVGAIPVLYPLLEAISVDRVLRGFAPLNATDQTFVDGSRLTQLGELNRFQQRVLAGLDFPPATRYLQPSSANADPGWLAARTCSWSPSPWDGHRSGIWPVQILGLRPLARSGETVDGRPNQRWLTWITRVALPGTCHSWLILDRNTHSADFSPHRRTASAG